MDQCIILHNQKEGTGDPSPLAGEGGAAKPRRVRGFLSAVGFFFCLLVILLVGGMSARAAQAQESSQNIAYDRIMKTGEIRCGYFIWPPFFNKDLNTGAFSGIFYDLMAEVANRTELKVTWAAELNFGTYVQDLATRKYDAECVGGWPTPVRAKLLAYTQHPLFYIGYVPVVRVDDTRFDKDISKINDPAIKVVGIDGEQAQIIRRHRFPDANEVSLPQTATKAELMFNVTGHKADVTFLDAISAGEFIAQNPGKVKIVSPDKPLKLIPQVLSMGLDEIKLQNMLNVALEEMLLDGTVDRILDKYDPEGTKFYRVAPPFMMKRKQ